MTSLATHHPRIGVEEPRICVEDIKGWKSTHIRGKLPHHVLSHVLEEVERDPSLASSFQSHTYAQDSTHMRGRQAPFQLFQGHTHALKQAYAWKTFSPA
ncbi:hypothetical protein PIB30_110942 [Stylosanthes scabra]|uniref:Uncharacterized protein n=1 Tax=Stylosanthes scabra TaxID=79078 RepID=A0ABU6QZL6_9FABA|nr:hypothetical protein [Stylosanthes scabra]